MSIKAIISTLPFKIKADAERELYQDYMAKLSRLATEYLANFVSILSQGEIQASYISVDFHDLIHPKPVDIRSADDIIGNIKNKLENMQK